MGSGYGGDLDCGVSNVGFEPVLLPPVELGDLAGM